MDLIVFLGSGVSIESGLPLADEITDAVLRGSWHGQSDLLYSAGKDPNEYPGRRDEVPNLQTLLTCLKGLVDPFFMNRERGHANYEDLYYHVRQIRRHLTKNIPDPGTALFYEKLKKCSIPKLGKLLPPYTFEYLFEMAERYINCVVWNELSTDGKPKGLDALVELTRTSEIGEINIFTLNHDLLVERLFQDAGIDYCDGFGLADGDLRLFKPSLFDDSKKVTLCKLHGSINWLALLQGTAGTEMPRYAVCTGNDYWHPRNAGGQICHPGSALPLFLTGSYNKPLDYSWGIFSEMHYRFHQTLAQTNHMVMSGYGWNDIEISHRVLQWLMENKRRRLLLLHENPDDLNKSQSGFWHKYPSLSNDGRIITIQKFLKDVSASEVLSAFQS